MPLNVCEEAGGKATELLRKGLKALKKGKYSEFDFYMDKLKKLHEGMKTAGCSLRESWKIKSPILEYEREKTR